MPGLAVLQEIPGELGGMLWHSLRTVSLWSAVQPCERSGLFCPGAQERRLADLLALGLDPALEEPLMTLARLLAAPERVSTEHVGLACSRIAAWAQTRGAQATQVEFSQAAALACPGNARLALAAGRAIRDQGEYPRAESWYQRAVGLARQAGDWDAYARAYIGIGKVWIARGVYPAARKSLLKAHRAAERHSLRDVAGMALHDLFTVESDCHCDAEAHAYAEAALRSYGPGHRELPSLANDIAYFWMSRGRFAEALFVLRTAVPQMGSHYRLFGQGNLARAAGAVRDVGAYRSAAQAVWEAADDTPGKADALTEVARAAKSLGLFARAQAAAEHAIQIATSRGEAKILFVAEGVLESVRAERWVQEQAAPSSADPPPPQADDLSALLVRSLEAGV